MKLIRVADNLYTQLSDQAKREKRSITKQLEIVLDAYYDSTAPTLSVADKTLPKAVQGVFPGANVVEPVYEKPQSWAA